MAAGQGDKRRSSGVAIAPPVVDALIVKDARCLIASMARREARSINDARGRGEHWHGLSFSPHEGDWELRERERERGRMNCRCGFAALCSFVFFFPSTSLAPLRTTKKKKGKEPIFELSKTRGPYISGTRAFSSTDALHSGADAVSPVGCHAQARCHGRDGGATGARSRFSSRRRCRRGRAPFLGASVDS